MSIGREIGRKVVLDVPSTETQGSQPVVTVAGWHGRRISQKKVGPNPGEATECHFQAASPVYANGIRILGMPVLPLVKYFVRELFIPRKPVCLRQRSRSSAQPIEASRLCRSFHCVGSRDICQFARPRHASNSE